MFTINDDLSIYANRGDIVFFSVSADDNGTLYKFQPGDIVRMSIYGRKEAETCVMQKDFPVTEVTEEVFIYLEEADTKIGDIISKHKDYWYEVVLNPDTMPQTIIGYDEDGAKVFRLFPESEEIDDNYDPQPEDFPVVDEELDMTSPRPIANKVVAKNFATVLDVCERTNASVAEKFVTPQMFGSVGDGKTDDAEALQAAIDQTKSGMVDLLGGKYLIKSSLEVANTIQNGTIIYNGDDAAPVFKMLNGGGLKDITVEITSKTFASDVVLVDYTVYDTQFNPLNFTLDGLTILAAATQFVSGSCCVHFVYDKYKVLVDQNINNIWLRGNMEYGIYIEPRLRNESDNPVFNTCVFSNVWFRSANCALYVRPTMASGTLENAQGALKLTLINFANQHTSGINKPFIDVHNTEIEGKCVIPWDYFGTNFPEEGTYKTLNSVILLDLMHFGENTSENVYYKYRKVMENEAYSNLPPLKMTELADDFNPLRSTGVNGAMENGRFVSTIPHDDKYGVKHYGVMFQSRNDNDPSGNLICQLLTRSGSTGTTLWLRKYFPAKKAWGDRQQIYGMGSVPTSWEGGRPDGMAAGDMKFDTVLKKPVWWDGSKWILADGSAAFK